MKFDHGLSASQLETIRQILAPYSSRITGVSLFGSRATGNYRANSDVDLVLYGDLEEGCVDRLWTMFSESSLPFSVDVKGYELIKYRPLRQHIDQVGRVLFTRSELGERKMRAADDRS